MLFRVGVADVVPKSIACRLLAPAMNHTESVPLVCREDKLEQLFAELANHGPDRVIADRPLPSKIESKGLQPPSAKTWAQPREAPDDFGKHERGAVAILISAVWMMA